MAVTDDPYGPDVAAARHGWIPVAEGLPPSKRITEQLEPLLVLIEETHRSLTYQWRCVGHWDGKHWTSAANKPLELAGFARVVAWQPFPPIPEEGAL